MTKPIKIESGIPIPDKYSAMPRSPIRQAYDQMKVGDSFQIGRKEKSVAVLYVAAKKSGIKIATRNINCEGIRVWRVK